MFIFNLYLWDHYVSSHLGFALGLKPKKIVGACESNGHLKFFIRWKNFDDIELVSAKEANEKCPQLVIDFYLDRLTWNKKKICCKND